MEGRSIHSALLRSKLSRSRECTERPRYVDLPRHSPRIGAVTEKPIHGKILRMQHEVEIGRLRIEPNCPIGARRLPLCLCRRCEKQRMLVEFEGRTL